MSDNLSNLTFEQIKINQTKEFKITITETSQSNTLPKSGMSLTIISSGFSPLPLFRTRYTYLPIPKTTNGTVSIIVLFEGKLGALYVYKQ